MTITRLRISLFDNSPNVYSVNKCFKRVFRGQYASNKVLVNSSNRGWNSHTFPTSGFPTKMCTSFRNNHNYTVIVHVWLFWEHFGLQMCLGDIWYRQVHLKQTEPFSVLCLYPAVCEWKIHWMLLSGHCRSGFKFSHLRMSMFMNIWSCADAFVMWYLPKIYSNLPSWASKFMSPNVFQLYLLRLSMEMDLK